MFERRGEEVSKGSEHGRLLLSVPVHPDGYVTKGMPVQRRGLCYPEAGDEARAFEVRRFERLSGGKIDAFLLEFADDARADPLTTPVARNLVGNTVARAYAQDILAEVQKHAFTADRPAGPLSKEWAGKLGLREDVVVGVGAIDAHAGAVGAGIKPYVLTKVIGTSTCDMLVAPIEELEGKLIHGICGQVDGSIIPGMLGMEAGQSAFGDVFAWFRDLLAWPLENAAPLLSGSDSEVVARIADGLLDELLAEAARRDPGPAPVLALDWINGRRTPDADQRLRGAVAGLGLGTDAPEFFKALIDATAFGARSIVERFKSEGVPVREVIALGGIPRKAPLVMQTLADVLDMPVRVSASQQACALGAAMFAATASGIYRDVTAAQEAMGSGFDIEFSPDRGQVERYASKYSEYLRMGEFAESIIGDK